MDIPIMVYDHLSFTGTPRKITQNMRRRSWLRELYKTVAEASDLRYMDDILRGIDICF